MNYVKLGNSGLDVSPICLGCMSFGYNKSGFRHDAWVLNEAAGKELVEKALGLGINFFDTANIYSIGSSEEYLGRYLKQMAQRDEVVVATKLYNKMKEGPNNGGLSRKAIFTEVDNSLKRLGMDYIDLYIAHRWDNKTPYEEIMEAFHDVIKAGKVRYIGASGMYAWQFSKAQYTAERHGWTKFISMQNHYNLVYREEELEMMPLCADMKIAVTPYSPLARGILAREWLAETHRHSNDAVTKSTYGHAAENDRLIVERVANLSKKLNVPMAHIALAWLLHKPMVTSLVIGATKNSHIEEAVAALAVKLSPEDMIYLEAPYLPHRTTGI
ncbi:MAG: aldo/keto reductase [Spirochaetaceae bacterium]|nr:aldo/keto reductase [Spirochaetaceae bacterium]